MLSYMLFPSLLNCCLFILIFIWFQLLLRSKFYQQTFQQTLIWIGFIYKTYYRITCHLNCEKMKFTKYLSDTICKYPIMDKLGETKINLLVRFWTESQIACFLDFRKLSYFVFMLIKVPFKIPTWNPYWKFQMKKVKTPTDTLAISKSMTHSLTLLMTTWNQKMLLA